MSRGLPVTWDDVSQRLHAAVDYVVSILGGPPASLHVSPSLLQALTRLLKLDPACPRLRFSCHPDGSPRYIFVYADDQLCGCQMEFQR